MVLSVSPPGTPGANSAAVEAFRPRKLEAVEVRASSCCGAVCRGADVAWLDVFTAQSTAFFNPCPNCVGTGREVTTNFFCVDCCDPIGFCSTCAGDHAGHRHLQIRRSSYHDVVKVQDLQTVCDISGIQTYMINSSRVIFVRQRPQPRPSNAPATCELCCRQVQENNKFCSLRCKLEVAGVLAPDTPPPAKVAKKAVHYVEAAKNAAAAVSASQPGTPSNSEGGMPCTMSDLSDGPSSRRKSSRRYPQICATRSVNSRRKHKRPRQSPLE